MRKKEGQILILVLLVVVVALAVGLSVGARNITNLKTSTQSEQSQRAFTAAEGGVEDVLSKLNSVASVIGGVVGNSSTTTGGTTCTKPSANQANCTLQNASTATGVSGTVNVTANSAYTKSVDLGDVAQINLEITPLTAYYAHAFTIEWASRTNGDLSDVALEFAFICDKTALTTCGAASQKLSGEYGQHGNPSGLSGTPAISDCGVNAGAEYYCTTTFDFTSATTGKAKILRIKPLYGKVAMKVTSADASFPVQTYVITSVATTDTGVTRKVEVRRDALPQMPAFFDYALYSGGAISK